MLPLQISLRQEKWLKMRTEPKNQDYQILFQQAWSSTRKSTKKTFPIKRNERNKKEVNTSSSRVPRSQSPFIQLPLSTSYPHHPLYLPLTLLLRRILPQRSTIPNRIPQTHQNTSQFITSNIFLQQIPRNFSKAPKTFPLPERLSQLFLRLVNTNLIAEIPPKPTMHPLPKRLQPEHVLCLSYKCIRIWSQWLLRPQAEEGRPIDNGTVVGWFPCRHLIWYIYFKWEKLQKKKKKAEDEGVRCQTNNVSRIVQAKFMVLRKFKDQPMIFKNSGVNL